MRNRTLAMLAVFTLVSAAPVSAQVLDKTERICAAAKLKATGKKESAKLKCEAKALLLGLSPTDPDCLGKAETKFSAAFGKAEDRGGCVSTLDTAGVEGAVDTFVRHEVNRQKLISLAPPPCDALDQPCGTCGDGICALADEGQVCLTTTGGTPICPETGCPEGMACVRMDVFNPFPIPIPELSFCLPGCGIVEPPTLDKPGRICAASKLKATGKKGHSKFKCEAKGILKELESADPDCLVKAENKFLGAFGKAEEKGGCFSAGDAAAVEAAVDEFVSEQVLRQKSGTGVDLPYCPTPSAQCGSCSGGGMCLATDQGQVCASPTGAFTPCPTAGCPEGMACISSVMFSGCVFGCP